MFGLHSGCLVGELPPLSMLYEPGNICGAQKGLSKSLALLCYAGLVGSSVPYKVA